MNRATTLDVAVKLQKDELVRSYHLLPSRMKIARILELEKVNGLPVNEKTSISLQKVLILANNKFAKMQ